jgi:hypothetical protein
MLSREEFELWLEEHQQDVLERIDVERAPLASWAKLFGRSLAVEAQESLDDDDGDDEESYEEDGQYEDDET